MTRAERQVVRSASDHLQSASVDVAQALAGLRQVKDGTETERKKLRSLYETLVQMKCWLVNLAER